MLPFLLENPMGLFGGSSKTYRSSSISRMMEDKEIKSASRMAMNSYLNSSDSASTKFTSKTLNEYMMEAAANSSVPKLKKAFKLSQKSDYTYGQLQASNIYQANTDVKSAVEDAITAQTGKGVTVSYGLLAEPNMMHLAWQTLQDSYGYQTKTNILNTESSIKGFDVYVEDIKLIISDVSLSRSTEEQLMLYGKSPTSKITPFRTALDRPFTETEFVTGDADPYAVVTCVYKDSQGNKVTYTIDIGFLVYISKNITADSQLDLSNNVIDPDAVAISYTPSNVDKDLVMALYTIDGVETYLTYIYGSKTNPYLDQMVKGVNGVGSFVPRAYARLNGRKLTDDKSMTKLCKMYGFDWSAWVDQLHENVGDLQYVLEMYMTCGVAVNDNDQVNQQYLYSHFLELYKSMPSNRLSTFGISSGLFGKAINYGGLSPSSFKQGANIRVQDRAKYSGYSFAGISYKVTKGVVATVGKYSHGFYSKAHYFRKQLTEDTYSEIIVLNLTSFEEVQGEVFTNSGTDGDLIIPLDIANKAGLTFSELERLYIKSMHIVVNTSQTVKKKWYETGIFKVIVLIIVAVIGYFFPPAWAAGAGLYAGAVGAIYAVGMSVAVGLAIKVVFKVLTSLGLSGELINIVALVVAVIAIAYGGYASLNGATVTAQTMMTISSSAFQLGSMGAAAQLAKMYEEFNKTLGDFSERDKALEARAAELGLHRLGDATTFLFEKPSTLEIRLGEDPEDYFTRSIHSPNPGALVYDYQAGYYDNMLALPSLQSILKKIEALKT